MIKSISSTYCLWLLLLLSAFLGVLTHAFTSPIATTHTPGRSNSSSSSSSSNNRNSNYSCSNNRNGINRNGLHSRNSRHVIRRGRLSSFEVFSGKDDPIVQLPLLQAQLANELDTARRTDLKNQIHQAETAAEFGVRKAQSEFYDAFSSQNLDEMEDVWTLTNDCECIHPGMESIRGRHGILASWAMLFQSSARVFPRIEPHDTHMDICGTTAMVRCVEQVVGSDGRLEAMNVYRRERGRWKLTLHMASPIAMQMPPPGDMRPDDYDDDNNNNNDDNDDDDDMRRRDMGMGNR